MALLLELDLCTSLNTCYSEVVVMDGHCRQAPTGEVP